MFVQSKCGGVYTGGGADITASAICIRFSSWSPIMLASAACAAVHKVDQNNVSWAMTADLHIVLLVSVLCGGSLPLGGEVSGNNKQCWAVAAEDSRV